MTPEGRVKKAIKRVLDDTGPDLYYHMPVPFGYGKPTLDFVGCFQGLAFTIEAKAPGEVPTPRQEETIKEMRNARMKVFVIDGGSGVTELRMWIAENWT